MLFLLSGAAASGKTTVAGHLAARVPHLAVRDENDIPATTGHGRMANMEQWIERALALESESLDLLLTAASPLGEVLASPHAPDLAGIAACVLDCHDHERRRRIVGRGLDPDWPFNMDTLCWAAWHRMHAVDPQWEQRVLRDAERARYHWDRWTSWTRDDPRWQVELIDSTTQQVNETVDAVVSWIQRIRAHGTVLSRTAAWWNVS